MVGDCILFHNHPQGHAKVMDIWKEVYIVQSNPDKDSAPYTYLEGKPELTHHVNRTQLWSFPLPVTNVPNTDPPPPSTEPVDP